MDRKRMLASGMIALAFSEMAYAGADGQALD